MGNTSSLGDFLRARRAAVAPAEVGLTARPGRRVDGLRRAEVAALAGISTDYYLRLEQGRECHPSEQVIAALAKAMLLDEHGRGHLRALASGGPQATARESPDPGLSRMLQRWEQTPAMILGHRLDLLAANPLAEALFPGLDNMVDWMFTDPRARDIYPAWDISAANTVAALRASVGANTDDPELRALIHRLSAREQQFARLWARHDVRHKTHRRVRLNHPVVGELDLEYDTLSINSATAQQLIVYQPAAGSTTSAARLAALSEKTLDQ